MKKLKKGCDEKDVKLKGGSQGLCENAVDHIKNFDNDDPGAGCNFFIARVFLVEIHFCPNLRATQLRETIMITY